MKCTVEFGQEVKIGVIIDGRLESMMCDAMFCDSIADAREVKEMFGGRIIRQSTKTEVF